jgi:transcriptional regulator with XRE-family HTH domain
MARPNSYELNGDNVAKARLAIIDERGRPLSQQALADRVGLNRVSVANIERNAQRVSLEVLERLSVALGRSREHLLGEPEQVDEYELARERMATAMSKIGEGFEDFAAAVQVLEDRARRSAEQTEVEA